MWDNRCMLLKLYFDEHLAEICNSIQFKFKEICFVYSNTFAEVYYALDVGLEISKRMHELEIELANADIREQNHTITPYDVIQRPILY